MAKLEHEALVRRVRATIDRVLALEKRRVFEVDGRKVHPSEAHLLLLVDRDPSINLTGIAERLGLTKGAVSQTLTRLERKGLITKERDPARRNELVLGFTENGRKAVRRFRRLETALARRLDRHFRALRESERRIVDGFLRKLGVILEEVG
jgi:DNA-binding MarR family transcriptional regulator